MVPGDIAFKSNFAFMNLDTGIVERRRVDRTFADWGVPLCDSLNDIPVDGFPEYRIFC
jgi:2,3-bisphosphoglycerate-independent phosphoglycerate mutase